jgi:hypothetical protein
VRGDDGEREKQLDTYERDRPEKGKERHGDIIERGKEAV